VGRVSKAFLKSNSGSEARLLVGGGVITEKVLEEVQFSCAPIPGAVSAACTAGEVRLQQYVATSIPGNAMQSEILQLGYFKTGECYDICDPMGVAQPLHTMFNTELTPCTDVNVFWGKFQDPVCAPGVKEITMRTFTDSACTVASDVKTIDVDGGNFVLGYELDCFCPSTEYIKYIE